MIENIICIDNSSNRTYFDWAIVVVSILLYVFFPNKNWSFKTELGGQCSTDSIVTQTVRDFYPTEFSQKFERPT